MIRALAAEPGADGSLHVVGVSVGEARGIRRGQVVDIDSLAQALRPVLEKLEQTLGVKLERGVVNIGGAHISAQPSRGVVAVSRADSEISNEDVMRVLAAAQVVPLGSNREVLHVIPQEFIVDGTMGLKNVIGMNGVRLEVQALLIQVSSPALRNLERALIEGGVRPEAFVNSSLAAAEVALQDHQKELGVLLLDIGAGTTDLAVFEEGECIHAAVVPIGSGHITSDIAIGMRSPVEIAEKAKIEWGTCLPETVSKKEMIRFADLGVEDGGEFSKRELAEIIRARVEELFDLVQKELRKINRDKLLPGGVVLVGCGAKLRGTAEFAKSAFALPVRLGLREGSVSLPSQLRDPSFALVCGLLRWQETAEEGHREGFAGKLSSRLRLPSPAGFIRLKKFLRSILP